MQAALYLHHLHIPKQAHAWHRLHHSPCIRDTIMIAYKAMVVAMQK